MPFRKENSHFDSETDALFCLFILGEAWWISSCSKTWWSKVARNFWQRCVRLHTRSEYFEWSDIYCSSGEEDCYCRRQRLGVCLNEKLLSECGIYRNFSRVIYWVFHGWTFHCFVAFFLKFISVNPPLSACYTDFTILRMGAFSWLATTFKILRSILYEKP